MGKKSCKAVSFPAVTKVGKYIALMRRIFLIDCPGVVYEVGDDEVDTVLKGVVRAERLDTPTDFIAAILSRVKKEYIQRQYLISDWEDHEDFLAKLALRNGKLLKGGEPDLKSVAVSVINDWQRGKLPYFIAPPKTDEDDQLDEEGEEETEDQLVLGGEREDDDAEEDGGGGDSAVALDEDDEQEEEEIEVVVKAPAAKATKAKKAAWTDI